MVGAIGGLVEIGLNVWSALRGEKKDEAESAGQLAVETEDGQSIPLVDVLKNHEERIQAVEKKAAKRPRRRKAR